MPVAPIVIMERLTVDQQVAPAKPCSSPTHRTSGPASEKMLMELCSCLTVWNHSWKWYVMFVAFFPLAPSNQISDTFPYLHNPQQHLESYEWKLECDAWVQFRGRAGALTV